MPQRLDEPLEVIQDIPLAPSTHPPIVLPADALLPGITTPHVLGFAPPPTVADRFPIKKQVGEQQIEKQPIIADRPAPLLRPRGRLSIGWYEIAVITLILICMVLGLYRLIWAIQL